MKSFLIAITLALVAGLGVMALNKDSTRNVITCTICKDLIQLVDDAILANQTIEDIENILFGACELLAGLEQSCKDFVHQQLPIIIDLLVNEYLNPEEVCFDLYLCP